MKAPQRIAVGYLERGTNKAETPALQTIVLAAVAGMFVGLSCVGANTAAATITNPSLARLAAAAVFPTALALILLAGGELFTGNTLLIIPFYERRIRLGALLRNWGLVFLGNFIGSFVVVGLAWAGNLWSVFEGAAGLYTIKIAAAKCSLDFSAAFALGIGCNFLVCGACWISYGSETAAGKIIGIYMPILMFVLCGFEHSVANMYYIPAGILALANPLQAAAAAYAGLDTTFLTWANFFSRNLLPVTLGNIVGGALLLGTPYWLVYLKESRFTGKKTRKAA